MEEKQNKIKMKKQTREDIIIKTENLVAEIIRQLELRLDTKVNLIEVFNGDYVDEFGTEQEGTRISVSENIIDNLCDDCISEFIEEDEDQEEVFKFNMQGTIEGKFVNVQTDSHYAATRLLGCMDYDMDIVHGGEE